MSGEMGKCVNCGRITRLKKTEVPPKNHEGLCDPCYKAISLAAIFGVATKEK